MDKHLITVRISTQLHERVKEYLESTGETASEFLRKSVNYYIDKQEERKAKLGLFKRDKKETIFDKKQKRREEMYQSYVTACEGNTWEEGGHLKGVANIYNSRGEVGGHANLDLTNIKIEIEQGLCTNFANYGKAKEE